MLAPSIDTPVFAAGPKIPGAYSMKAKGGGTAEILLYGDVGDEWFGGVTAKQFADDLKALGDVSTIDLRINSAGGDVFQGLTIYRRLVEHSAKIIVHIDGLAASIASIIAMAGDEIRIGESAFLMIHNAWGLAVGNGAEMRRMADLLDATTASLRDVYVERTGNTTSAVSAWMDAETWFNADDALENGFVDSVEMNLRIAAHVDTGKFKFTKVPAVLLATPNADAARERVALMKLKMDRRRAA